jgi:hypothetical protein
VLTNNTSWHAPADMTNTLRELQAKIWSFNCHCSVPGSKVNAEVTNIISEGMWNYMPIDADELNLNERSSELEVLEVEDFDAM